MPLLQNYYFFGKKPMMISVSTVLALCFAVGCSTTVIQPRGPRMCEQISRMSGTNMSTYEKDSLSCKVTGERVKEDTCGSVEQRQTMQMRCVMCTEIPLNPVTKRCQDVDGHTVCAFIKDNRSCVFTSKMTGEDQGIKYNHCRKESGLTRQQRQMSCVLLSRLVKIKELIIPEEQLWTKHMVPGVKVSMQCSTINESTTYVNPICSRDLDRDIWNGNIPKFQKDFKNIHRNSKRSERYDTALMRTTRSGQDVMFDMLLGFGAHISTVNNDTNTVLHLACIYGRLHMVRTLVDIGCDVEKKGRAGRTPILNAAISIKFGVFHYLLSKECNLSVVDKFGNSVLHLACKRDRLTPLTATRSAMGSIDIEGRNIYGATPLLSCAQFRGTVEMVKYLYEMGADMAAVNNVTGNTILHDVARRGKYYDFELVKYVVSQKQVKLDSTNKKGETPLMLAKHYKHEDAVEYLKEQ